MKYATVHKEQIQGAVHSPTNYCADYVVLLAVMQRRNKMV
jgi:hypothetical protein